MWESEGMEKIVEGFICSQFNQRMIDLVNRDNIDLEMQKELFDYCIKKAWDDAWVYSRNDQLYIQRQNYSAYLVQEIENAFGNENSILEYDEWFKQTITREKINDSRHNEMNIGRWQKFINMSMKYIYCISDKLNHDNYIYIRNIPWSSCHFALDRYTLEWYYREVDNSINNSARVKWTQIDDYDTYNCIQQKIRGHMQNSKCPLKAELTIWTSEKIRQAIHEL